MNFNSYKNTSKHEPFYRERFFVQLQCSPKKKTKGDNKCDNECYQNALPPLEANHITVIKKSPTNSMTKLVPAIFFPDLIS